MKNTFYFLIFMGISKFGFSQSLSELSSNSSLNIIHEFEDKELNRLCINRSGSFDGVIGINNRRIRIHFDSINKSKDDNLTYIFSGRTKVGNNICNFKGPLIFYFANKDFTYKERHEENDIEGILKGHYIFRENPNQQNAGYFSGELLIYWTLKDDSIVLGNGWYTTFDYGFAFEGTWQSYTSDKVSKCCWSNYRIPCVSDDFDTSDGPDVIPNEKYKDVGWGNLRTILTIHPNTPEYKAALKTEKEESNWWKK